MSPQTTSPLDRRFALADKLERHRRMIEIRLFEDAVKEIFFEGLIPGTTHTAQGQEAVAVGIASVLRPTDTVACTYRGHHHALALGMTPDVVLGEIMGKETGCISGMGGSMHLSSKELGLLPTMAVIGAGIPIAAGAALTAQTLGTDDVAVGIFGDGTVNIGAFHEGLNLAALWTLPVVFICENNLYGEYSPLAATTAGSPDLVGRVAPYGMPAEIVDGQDVEAVASAVQTAVDRARTGGGPTFLEMKTYRYSGHSRTDPATYRPAGELDAWLARDPILIAERRLCAAGALDEDQAARVRELVAQDVAEVVARTKAAAYPSEDHIFRHIYASPLGTGTTGTR